MTLRRLGIAGLLALMVAFGVGVYYGLGNLKHAQANHRLAKRPEKTHPLVNLPGTIIVAQGGTLYRLQNGTFKPIVGNNWVQPAVTPDHQHLVAARREYNYSDLYLLGLDGSIQKQLTDNVSGMVQFNHWSLHPRVSPDGQTVFYSYDWKPDCGPQGCYQVDFSIFAQPLSGHQKQARRWTFPNGGTGGDIQPISLGPGGILFARYSMNAQSEMFSQIWWQPTRALYAGQVDGHALTAENQSCYAPALSPDGTRLAMVCAPIGQATATQLVVAPLSGHQLGPPTVVATGFINSPTWSPDGKSLLYFAPANTANGYFQLFYLPLAPPPTPAPRASGKTASPAPPPAPPPLPQPKQVTSENDFDPTTAPIWF
jgi:hypothetical protein